MQETNRDPATGMLMGEKVRTYFLGFLLGCAMVGLLLVSRCNMNARDRAQREAEQQAGQSTIPPGAALPTGPR